MDTTQISRRQILVVGSCNTDMVIKAAHLPRPGETILGGTFFMNPGGKGANQAVAIARLGGSVTFICKTGSDIFGHQSQQLFEEEGINTSYVFSDSGNPSGVALITVDEKAENCIVVASGANANLLPSDLAKAEEAIELADLILMQLEVPMETVLCCGYRLAKGEESDSESGSGTSITGRSAPSFIFDHAERDGSGDDYRCEDNGRYFSGGGCPCPFGNGSAACYYYAGIKRGTYL